MRVRAWVVSVSAISILAVGGFGSGCGSVTPVEPDAGGRGGNPPGGKGGTNTGGSGGNPAGTGGGSGGADSIGTAGVTGRGADGGFSGGGSGGSGGVTTGGRGGTSVGTTGAGGVDGVGGKGGTGGVATGGRGGGGNAGAGGATGTGGRGGTTGAGGALAGVGGIGGIATGGRGGGGTGGASGTGGTGGGTGGSGGASGTGGGGGTMCARGACPALTIADLEGIDHSKAPGFDAPGFRCKSATVCPPSGSCIYFSTTAFGSVQSAEDTYTDGAKQTTPMAVHVVIDGGAASQCGNPAITFTADESFTLTFDGGKKVPVYLPATTGGSFTLYVATDGSTFYDAALANPARLRP